MAELLTFIVAGGIVLAGALGVVLLAHPVHAALSLVATLFGVAVLFVAQEAHFLAAVQVIVYAGAIVVLFLFVIMLMGVDQAEDLRVEPLVGQRPAAVVSAVAVAGLSLVSLFVAGGATGAPSQVIPNPQEPDITGLGRLLFTEYAFAFEATAILLTIAVVGAVLLTRRPPVGEDADGEPADATPTNAAPANAEVDA
ncbi:MAG: NADH-quinone oxidoreductase subunit J [Acidimicrobiales bacterium]